MIKDIKGYEGLYAVTEEGNLWSYPKRNNPNGRFLKAGRTGNDYWTINLHKKGDKQRSFYIHRIVAETYIGKIDGKDCINHIDGDKSNNKKSNLEWCTYSENHTHAYNKGLHKRSVSVDEASEICEAYATGLFSQREIAEFIGIARSTVGRIIKGGWNIVSMAKG